MSSDDASHNLTLGKNIREVRKERKMSLEQLAKGTKMSIGFLSQLETGKANVSVDNIRKIAEFLDVKMVRFFEENDEDSELGIVTRKGDGLIRELEDTNSYCEMLIGKGHINLQATLFVNPPGEGRKKPQSHVGEEFVYVIMGETLIRLNDKEYHLNEGDSIVYRSETQHSFENPGQFQNVMIIVNSPPFR